MFTTVETLRKYGEINEVENNSFNTEKELKTHLSDLKKQHDKTAYNKWTLEVQASNGTNFNIKLNL